MVTGMFHGLVFLRLNTDEIFLLLPSHPGQQVMGRSVQAYVCHPRVIVGGFQSGFKYFQEIRYCP